MTEEQRKAYLERVKIQNDEIKKVVENVLMTDSGKKLFRHLHNICGYSLSSIVVNSKDGEISPNGTTFNESRRAVYINLRELAPVELLREVEYSEKTEEKK